MMKNLYFVFLLVVLCGCSSAPQPPEPEGEWQQVNQTGKSTVLGAQSVNKESAGVKK